jgi:Domain of unknown function (DUF4192)
MSGVAPARQVLKLSGPPDVVAAVPFVVGFQPVESLVVIALHGPRQELQHTLRVDLSDVEEMRRRSLTDQPCHPKMIANTLKRNGATSALVVILTETPGRDDLAGRSLAGELRDELAKRRIPVRDAMLVQGGRWFSYLCDDPACCPAEGTPVAGAAHDRVAAELVLAGDAPYAGREEIERQVAAESGLRAQAVEAAVHALLEGGAAEDEEGPFAVLSRAFDLVREGQELDPQTAALCLVSLPRFEVRDTCLQPWEGQDGEVALRLWCALTRLAPDYLVPAPACLAAFVALCRGSGALANSAIDRALAASPNYSFARLLLEFAANAVPPKVMRRMAQQVTRPGEPNFLTADDHALDWFDLGLVEDDIDCADDDDDEEDEEDDEDE